MESLLRSEQELIAACLALGARSAGGPLSRAERRLAEGATPTDLTKNRVQTLRTAIREGDDPLGLAFCTIRPGRERRRQGAFYTDSSIVESMVAWLVAKEPEEIVDAGCGSARFALACRRAGFAGRLVAIDVDPLATLIGRANLAASGFSATVLNDDFLTADLPPPRGRRAFLGNPPYVRHHNLAKATKAWAKQMGHDLGLEVSGLAGLHALFILRVARDSRYGDVGCFVTSSEWLDVGYGRAIRKLLSDRLGCVRIDLIDPRSEVFSDAMATGLIVCWEQGYRGAVTLRRVASREDLTLNGGGVSRGPAALDPAKKWSPLFSRRRNGGGNGLIPLSAIARVHRGVVTGANEFFILTAQEAERLGLAAWTRPCLHRAQQVFMAQGIVRATRMEMRLLDASERNAHEPTLRRYIEEGERRGLDQRYVCAHRRPWWRVGGKRPPQIITTYMARRPPAFAWNPDSCQILNVFHGIHLLEDVDDETVRLLVRWLNQNAAEFEGGRTYHGGLRKFEPSELESLRVPPLEKLHDLVADPA